LIRNYPTATTITELNWDSLLDRKHLFVGTRVRLRLALQNQELAASDLAG